MNVTRLMMCGAVVLGGCSPAGDTKTASPDAAADVPVLIAARERRPSARHATKTPPMIPRSGSTDRSRPVARHRHRQEGRPLRLRSQARETQFVQAGLVNNVDLRDGFQFADGMAPIVVASDRDDQTIAVFRFDPADASAPAPARRDPERLSRGLRHLSVQDAQRRDARDRDQRARRRQAVAARRRVRMAFRRSRSAVSISAPSPKAASPTMSPARSSSPKRMSASGGSPPIPRSATCAC